MNGCGAVRKLWLLLFVLGCGGEQDDHATATIAPADPRPAPTVTGTMDDRPMITTSGSPVPASAVAPGTQLVTLSASGISMRSLIPRAHTAFHIRNETASRHDLVLRSTTSSAAITVPAAKDVVLQAMLSDPAYELACVTPGHSERARFTTYVAGRPLNQPPGGASR